MAKQDKQCASARLTPTKFGELTRYSSYNEKPESNLKLVVSDHIKNSRISKRINSFDEFKQSDIELLYPTDFQSTNSLKKKNQDDNLSLSTLFIKKDNRKK